MGNRKEDWWTTSPDSRFFVPPTTTRTRWLSASRRRCRRRHRFGSGAPDRGTINHSTWSTSCNHRLITDEYEQETERRAGGDRAGPSRPSNGDRCRACFSEWTKWCVGSNDLASLSVSENNQSMCVFCMRVDAGFLTATSFNKTSLRTYSDFILPKQNNRKKQEWVAKKFYLSWLLASRIFRRAIWAAKIMSLCTWCLRVAAQHPLHSCMDAARLSDEVSLFYCNTSRAFCCRNSSSIPNPVLKTFGWVFCSEHMLVTADGHDWTWPDMTGRGRTGDHKESVTIQSHVSNRLFSETSVQHLHIEPADSRRYSLLRDFLPWIVWSPAVTRRVPALNATAVCLNQI